MNLYGFGLGAGFNGSASGNSGFKPVQEMSHEDSVKSAAVNINMGEVFKQYLLEEYGVNYQDSIQTGN